MFQPGWYFLVDTLSWYLFDFSSRYFVQLKWQRTLKSNRQSIVLNKGELCTVVEFKESLTMLYYKDKYWHFGFLLSLPSSWNIITRCPNTIVLFKIFSTFYNYLDQLKKEFKHNYSKPFHFSELRTYKNSYMICCERDLKITFSFFGGIFGYISP